ncbi:MAG: ABC transporter ATP-binding protein [Agathobacter sp.]|nr:ABC transporter ATP-binding protein [Agathobacter sp.]
MWQNTIYMMKIAWKYSKSLLFHIPILVILATLENLAELFIVPMILNSVETKIPLNDLALLVLGFTLLLVFTSGLQTYVKYISDSPRMEIRIRMKDMLESKRRTMSYPYMESSTIEKQYNDAELCTRSNWDSSQAIWTTLTDLLKAIVGCVIYISLLSHIHVSLLLIIIITSVINFYASKHFSEWEYRHKDEFAEYNNQCYYISEQAQNRKLAKDLRIFGMQPWLNELHTKGLRLTHAFTAKRNQQETIGEAIGFVLSFLRNGIAYIFLIVQVLNANMSAAEFLLYFNAIGNFTTWVTTILTQVETLHKQSLELCRFREFIELPELFLFEEGTSILPDNTKEYEIKLKNVSFIYPESDHYIFRNLNLTIHPGEKLAIVGLNGAGKTTLVKLICGLYDPTEGEVLLNGVNIKQYNRRDYYKHFSAVFQQFSILDAPIEVNIAQSVFDIDEARIEDVLEKAGLTEKISTLSNGIKSNVGRYIYEDGIELSGGETQRLMLARALYKDAPILVLDEPTAALDPIAENDIYMKYNEMTKNRTSLFISHRLASTRFCDRIVFLADETIAEEGTHTSLMELGGDYADLFEVQSKYYKEGDAEDDETETIFS